MHLNTVGFLPDRAKLAVVLEQATTFSLMRTDGAEVLSGTTTGPVHDADTGMDLWTIDFSAFAEPGEYYLDVPGVGRSVSFRIDADVYTDVTRALMLGMYGQRCGVAVELEHAGTIFSHGACHTRDAIPWEARTMGTVKDVTGGWHDAGDYGKYTNNAAFSLGMLFRAWELYPDKLAALALPIPEHGGPIPDFLAEAKVQVDQLLKMQREDGSVYQQISEVNFEGFISPESDTGTRYIFGYGTVQAAGLVAVAAAAARLFAPYDAEFAARCLAAAQKSWAYLQTTSFVPADMTGVNHVGYFRHDDGPDRLWAAAELWETTGDPALLATIESKLSTTPVGASWDWPNVGNLGVFTYVLSKRPGRDTTVLSAVAANVESSARTILTQVSTSGFGRGIRGYFWGCNGSVARATLNLMVANALQPDPAMVDAAVAQLDHLLGRNVFGRSFVTGLGHFPPIHPHHRPSTSVTWPGLLVGGPNGSATAWRDDRDAYDQNEIAINWNAAMIFGAAALMR